VIKKRSCQWPLFLGLQFRHDCASFAKARHSAAKKADILQAVDASAQPCISIIKKPQRREDFEFEKI
jgi:hypothetical protein